MNTDIGFVLVSQVHHTIRAACPKCPPSRRCERPPYPNCRAICIHDPSELAKHHECQEYERLSKAWDKAHPDVMVPNGRTSVGPLHYFRECMSLGRRGNARRPDSRIVAVNREMAEALALAICETCQARMAPFEKQLEDSPRKDHLEAHA